MSTTTTTPAVKVFIPTPLRAYTDQQSAVTATGATVGEALDHLTAQYQALRPHLFNDAGSLRSFVNIYVNDEDIRYLDRADTALKGGDEVSIVPSIAGGMP